MSCLQQIAVLRVADLAHHLDLDVRSGRHVGPCPACGSTRRSRKDKRPPVSLWMGQTHPKWTCFACSRKGGTVAFLCFSLFGEELQTGDIRWRDLIHWAEQRGLVRAVRGGSR